jgi:ankyrin repeat protein
MKKNKKNIDKNLNVMELISNNNIEIIIKNLDKIPLDKPIHLNNYLIHYAVYINRLDLLEAIIKKHNIWDYKDNLGISIVHSAAHRGFCEILQFLTDKFKEEILKVKNDIDSNIFFYIIENPQCLNILEKLNLKKYINEQNKNNQTPLSLVLSMLFDLVNIKINKSSYYYRQIQPKIITKKYNNDNPLLKSLHFLLKNGADPNAKIIEPLIVSAAKMNLLDIVEELINYKCDVNLSDKAGKTALGWAIYNNNIDMVKLLIKSGSNINIYTILGENYLPMLALNNANDNIIEYILEQNFDYEFTNYENNTMAHIILLNYTEYPINIIKTILKNTNNYNKLNLDGNTLGILICILNIDLLKILKDIFIEKRINLYIKNKEGKDGFDYIHDNKTKEIIIDIMKISLEKQLKDKKYVIPKEYEDINDLIINKKITCLYTKEEIDNDELEKKVKILEYPYANYSLFKNLYFDDLIMFGIIFNRNSKDMIIPFIDKEELINLDKYKKKSIENSSEFKIQMINSHYDFILYYFPEILTCDILWLDKHNYIFTEYHETAFLKALDKQQRFIVTMVGFFITDGENGHANILIYDKKMNIMERFDPEGVINIPMLDDLDEILKNKFSKLINKKDFTYISPKDYGIINSFQKLSDEINTLKRKTGDVKGFCQAWVFWYVEMRILNKDIHPIKLVGKLLNRLIKMNNNSILEYIRNYANDLRKKVHDFMIKLNINPKYINNEKYPEPIHKIVSNGLVNLIKNSM